MSQQGIMPRNLSEHILSEHEAGYTVRELLRADTSSFGDDDSKLETSSQGGRVNRSQVRLKYSSCNRIQRRNQELEQENAFLKKAAAWFASDSGVQRGGTGRTN